MNRLMVVSKKGFLLVFLVLSLFIASCSNNLVGKTYSAGCPSFASTNIVINGNCFVDNDAISLQPNANISIVSPGSLSLNNTTVFFNGALSNNSGLRMYSGSLILKNASINTSNQPYFFVVDAGTFSMADSGIEGASDVAIKVPVDYLNAVFYGNYENAITAGSNFSNAAVKYNTASGLKMVSSNNRLSTISAQNNTFGLLFDDSSNDAVTGLTATYNTIGIAFFDSNTAAVQGTFSNNVLGVLFVNSSNINVTNTQFNNDILAFTNATGISIYDSTNPEFQFETYFAAFNYVYNTTIGATDFASFDNTNLYVGWYLDVSVTNETGAMNNVRIDVTDKYGTLTTVYTDASGSARLPLVSYRENRTGFRYYSNYTVNASFGNLSSSKSINLTTNKQAAFSLNSSMAPFCTDSDNGLNTSSQGTVNASSGNVGTDFCFNTTSVFEYACSNITGTYSIIACSSNMTCSNGVCIGQTSSCNANETLRNCTTNAAGSTCNANDYACCPTRAGINQDCVLNGVCYRDFGYANCTGAAGSSCVDTLDTSSDLELCTSAGWREQDMLQQYCQYPGNTWLSNGAGYTVTDDYDGNVANGVCCGDDAGEICAAASCGDAVCNGNETCSSCSADCGACSYCTDSDNGNTIYVRGTVNASSGSSGTDVCVSTGIVTEYYCSNTTGVTSNIACSANMMCSNGACVNITCSDSDGGMIVNTYGSITLSNGTSYVDACLTNTSLTERYCTGNYANSTTLNCSAYGYNSCLNGVCVNLNQSYFDLNFVSMTPSTSTPYTNNNITINSTVRNDGTVNGKISSVLTTVCNPSGNCTGTGASPDVLINANATYSVVDTYAFNASGMWNISRNYTGNQTDIIPSNNYQTISFSVSEPPVCGDSSCNGAEDCNSCSADCGQCEQNEGGGGGGGGGGAGAPPKATERTSAFDFFNEYDVTVTYNGTKNINVTMIQIEPDIDAELVYAGFRLNSTFNITEGTIDFKISKKWTADNNANTSSISLKQKSTNWKKLPTEQVKQDTVYTYYSSEITQLGTFAITALENQQAPQQQTPGTVQNETPDGFTNESLEDVVERGNNGFNLFVYVIIIIFMVIALGGYFYYRALHTLHLEHKDRLVEKQNELREYVEKELKRNVSPDEIRKTLIEAGWKQEVVDKAMNDAQKPAS